ncbi:MAG: chromosomal replication initiator protein DnaA [Bifidobacteriaceae bacterium]|jgi:chromosomal replication initiator protein|nr:chromosomal replication initiator protein DnaA [Bifidobacteriaceae bacterium]
MDAAILWSKVVDNLLKSEHLAPILADALKKITFDFSQNSLLVLSTNDSDAKNRVESDISVPILEELQKLSNQFLSFTINLSSSSSAKQTSSSSSAKQTNSPESSDFENQQEKAENANTENSLKIENSLKVESSLYETSPYENLSEVPTISEVVKKTSSIKSAEQIKNSAKYFSESPIEKSPDSKKEKNIFGKIAPNNSRILSGYTFDSFVTAENNSFAVSACIAVAENPNIDYNPLLIHGKSGMGKTHLLHAIGNRYMEKYDNTSILYCTSEEFINDYIYTIREGNMHKFKNKYTGINILLIDDVQFFVSKTSSQEQFVHIFNQLISAGKQVVMTSDVHPDQLDNLPDRLKTRMKNTVVGLSPVSYETKVAILKSYSGKSGQVVPKPLLEIVAQRSGESIRELIGLYKTVMNYLIFAGKALSAEEAYKYLTSQNTNVVITEQSKNKPQTIIKNVCDFYNAPYEEVVGSSRRKSIVFTRNLCVFILRKTTNLSLSEVGSYMGERDHSTILNCYNKAEKMISQDSSVFDQIKIFLNISQPLISQNNAENTTLKTVSES